ncbi:MAG: hypothetical protein HZA88_16080 [Verrucomicrobia bacterium]|nr:hypothetical protein [Verrucomicrobiota bacterium]
MILWQDLQQEQKDEQFKSFQTESSSDKIHCLVLYDDRHSGVEDLARNTAFWKEHRVLADDHCVCIGVKNPPPSADDTDKKSGAASRLMELFGCGSNDMPCLVVCQLLRWSNAMRHMVVPLASGPTSELGRLEVEKLLKRMAQEMRSMLDGHFPDGYFLYTGIEYSLGDLTSKRGLVAAQAVWDILKEAA